jgi:hypothetical protein
MLRNSNVEFQYAGFCTCKNWDEFLPVILSCVLNHKAPFSPLFYDIDEEFVFYFHHTGGVGLLYKTETTAIKKIIGYGDKG